MGRTANPNLTVDELDTLFHLAEGLTVPEIAKRHQVSRRTVEWRVEQLKRKLDAKTLAHVIVRAYQKGIFMVNQEEMAA